jgi:hypothetical protein
MKKFILALTTVFAAQVAHAGLMYNYSQLMLKDLEQMNKIIQTKISESRKEPFDKLVPLKEALQAVFSRPNEEFMIEKIISPLKSAIDEQNGWEKAMLALTTEALGALKNPKPFKPVVQVTYWIFLENVISEMKPQALQPFENKILTVIKKADIEITKQAKNER